MRFPVVPTIFLILMLQTGLVIVPNFVVPIPERHLLTRLLSEKSAMQVTLNGDIRLRFLPRPQIVLQDVTMSGATTGGDVLAVQTPYLLIDLDMAALTRQRFDVSSVGLLSPQINGKIKSPLHALLGRLQGESNPRVYIDKARLSISGLNRLDINRRVKISALSIDLPARSADTAIDVSVSHKLRGVRIDNVASARLRIDTPIGNRYRLSSAVQLGGGERLSFEGFLSAAGMAQADWHFDGELALASTNMVAKLLQHHSSLKLSEEAQYVGFAGLVRADSSGLRSNSLEIDALGTVFQSRLAVQWPQDGATMPALQGRLSTGTLNLNHFTLEAPTDDAAPPLIDDLWRGLATQLAVQLEIEATRFDLAGEDGANLSFDFDWRNGLIDIERLSVDLPFRSALIAAGTLNLAGQSPTFAGSFSARSLDALAAMIWLGDLGGRDFSDTAELIDDADLQRVSLVSDLDWSEAGLLLNRFTGRIGDDYFSGDMTLLDSRTPRASIDVQFNRFDLTDWGADDLGTARDIDVNSVWQPLNRLLEAQLSDAVEGRAIDIRFMADELYFGSAALGSARMEARIEAQRLLLENLQLSNLSGSSITASGTLNYDALPAYGQLALRGESDNVGQAADILLERLAPLRFVADAPLRVEADLLLTGRDVPDWPNAKLNGSGRLGDMQLQFDLVTPSRTLDYTVSGSNLSVALSGDANQLAAAVLLPTVYGVDDTGALQLELAAQSNNVSAVNGKLQLAGNETRSDTLELSGSLRPSADGPLLEGTLSFGFADGLPLLSGQAFTKNLTQNPTEALPLSARSQVSATAQKIGFSGLNAQFGGGTMSGEGVLQLGEGRPQLNAALRISDADFGWLLPRFGAQGWSDAEMRWSLLERANADIDMRLSSISLAALPIDALSGRLRLIDGVLEIPDVQAQLLGGTASGRVLAEGGQLTPLINIEAQFADLSLSAPLTALYGRALLEARLSGTAIWRARGASAAAMMAASNADLQFEIDAGRLGFVDLAGLRAALLDETRSGAAAPLVAQFAEPDTVGFTRGVGLLQSRAGRVNNATAEFIFDAPYGDARLNLNIDAVSRQLVAGMQIFPEPDKPIDWQISGDVMQPQVRVSATPYDRPEQQVAVEVDAPVAAPSP